MSSLLSNEEQLVLLERARGQDPIERRHALGALLLDFRGPALAAICRTLATCGIHGDAMRGLAEDALQEAVLKLVGGGLAAFGGRSSPRTYFVRIALNAALDAVRRGLRAAPLEEVAAERWETLSPSAEEQISSQELREALERCLAALRPGLRRSVQLYYLEEAGDCGECARLAGTTTGAFMQQLSRARAGLAECLHRRLGSEGSTAAMETDAPRANAGRPAGTSGRAGEPVQLEEDPDGETP